MGIDFSSSIADLSIGLSTSKVAGAFALGMLDKVMAQTADLAAGMLEILPRAGAGEVGGLLDVTG